MIVTQNTVTAICIQTVNIIHYVTKSSTVLRNRLVIRVYYKEGKTRRYILQSLELLKATHLEVKPVQCSSCLACVAGSSLIYLPNIHKSQFLKKQWGIMDLLTKENQKSLFEFRCFLYSSSFNSVHSAHCECGPLPQQLHRGLHPPPPPPVVCSSQKGNPQTRVLKCGPQSSSRGASWDPIKYSNSGATSDLPNQELGSGHSYLYSNKPRGGFE